MLDGWTLGKEVSDAEMVVVLFSVEVEKMIGQSLVWHRQGCCGWCLY